MPIDRRQLDAWLDDMRIAKHLADETGIRFVRVSRDEFGIRVIASMPCGHRSRSLPSSVEDAHRLPRPCYCMHREDAA